MLFHTFKYTFTVGKDMVLNKKLLRAVVNLITAYTISTSHLIKQPLGCVNMIG